VEIEFPAHLMLAGTISRAASPHVRAIAATACFTVARAGRAREIAATAAVWRRSEIATGWQICIND
jgi:hypothetical protein